MRLAPAQSGVFLKRGDPIMNFDEIVGKIEEGLGNLKNRKDFNTLRHKDRVWEIETPLSILKRDGAQAPEAIEHLVDIFMKTSTVSVEGEAAFNSTIWNANVQVAGKMTTLGGLFTELREGYNKSRN